MPKMLTLVHHQPGINPVTWSKLLQLGRQTRVRAARWRALACQRAALARLDDRLLADIGLTREAQMVECSKLYWWSL
jgi:uncharacterized protein YjiS (DUF1127 family)